MTISCITYLPPMWRWVIDSFISVLLLAVFFYLPVRLKTGRTWRIALFVIGAMLILFTQWVVITDYQCYQSFQPELVYDFNQQVTTRGQAVQILQDYILENYFPKYKTDLKNATEQPLLIEEYLKDKEERKMGIENSIISDGSTYIGYYFHWKFILHTNGKLYRQFAGD